MQPLCSCEWVGQWCLYCNYVDCSFECKLYGNEHVVASKIKLCSKQLRHMGQTSPRTCSRRTVCICSLNQCCLCLSGGHQCGCYLLQPLQLAVILTFDEIHSSSLMHWQLPLHPGSLFTEGIAEPLLKISPLPTCSSSLELWDQTAGTRGARLCCSQGLCRPSHSHHPVVTVLMTIVSHYQVLSPVLLYGPQTSQDTQDKLSRAHRKGVYSLLVVLGNILTSCPYCVTAWDFWFGWRSHQIFICDHRG